MEISGEPPQRRVAQRQALWVGPGIAPRGAHHRCGRSRLPRHLASWRERALGARGGSTDTRRKPCQVCIEFAWDRKKWAVLVLAFL